MIEIFTLPEFLADHIERVCFSNRISWELKKQTISDEEKKFFQEEYKFSPSQIKEFKIEDRYNFSSIVYIKHPQGAQKSETYSPLASLQSFVENNCAKQPLELLRMHVALLSNSYEDIIAHPHKDSNRENFFSFLYYVNDSDGDTLFFDSDCNVMRRISPKRGFGVFFNSNILHCAMYPKTNILPRVIVNMMFRCV